MLIHGLLVSAVVWVCGGIGAPGADRRDALQTLAVPMEGAGGFGVDVVIEERAYRLELRRHSVRANGFRVLEVRGDGSIIELAPERVTTYRGGVVGVEGSVVAGWLSPEGLHAVVHLGDEREAVWIEPDGGLGGLHSVLRESERAVEPGVCEGGIRERRDGARDAGGGGGGCGGELCIAEIACDTDVEFESAWAGSTVARIEAVINAVNVQFERDTGIRHEISTIIVRTGGAGTDPYDATEAGAVLTEFSTEWEDNQGGVVRDAAVLFSGKEFDGTVVGRAFVSSVCGLGYGVMQDRPVFSRLTDLCAHELGHCWGADHCACAGDAETGYTMNERITGANRFHPVESMPQIVSFRDGAACLDGLESGTAVVPFSDDFDGVSPPALDGVLWSGVDGAGSSTLGVNETSGTQSMHIGGDSQVRSARLDLSARQDISLAYDLQRGGGGAIPGLDDELVVEYRDNSGCWIELARHAGTDAAEQVFTACSHELPTADAQHDSVRLRFRGTTISGGDWFIDSVDLTSAPAQPGSTMLLTPSDGATEVRTDIRLDWNATAHTETYRLRVDDSPSFAVPMIDVQLTTPGFSPPGGLAAGTVLYWRVESSNAVGTTGSTPAVGSFTTFGTIPHSFDLLAPTGGAVVNTQTPTLSWGAAEGATSYRVLIDRFFDFFAPILDEAVVSPESGVVTYEVAEGVLDDGSFYYWRIEAVNLMGSRTGLPFAASFSIDTAALCDGDANGDGVVDVNDISAVLFALGEGGGERDVNSDGVVDVNDVAYVLFRLGGC